MAAMRPSVVQGVTLRPGSAREEMVATPLRSLSREIT